MLRWRRCSREVLVESVGVRLGAGERRDSVKLSPRGVRE